MRQIAVLAVVVLDSSHVASYGGVVYDMAISDEYGLPQLVVADDCVSDQQDLRYSLFLDDSDHCGDTLGQLLPGDRHIVEIAELEDLAPCVFSGFCGEGRAYLEHIGDLGDDGLG